jgi:hypothetical protein
MHVSSRIEEMMANSTGGYIYVLAAVVVGIFYLYSRLKKK